VSSIVRRRLATPVPLPITVLLVKPATTLPVVLAPVARASTTAILVPAQPPVLLVIPVIT
jgi:hypothetical protein